MYSVTVLGYARNRLNFDLPTVMTEERKENF